MKFIECMWWQLSNYKSQHVCRRGAYHSQQKWLNFHCPFELVWTCSSSHDGERDSSLAAMMVKGTAPWQLYGSGYPQCLYRSMQYIQLSAVHPIKCVSISMVDWSTADSTVLRLATDLMVGYSNLLGSGGTYYGMHITTEQCTVTCVCTCNFTSIIVYSYVRHKNICSMATVLLCTEHVPNGCGQMWWMTIKLII